jgi:hypothetical protein
MRIIIVNAVKTIFTRALPLMFCAAFASWGANLANPAAQAGPARMSFGASYYIGGADITNDTIPLMMNRVSGRASYSPVRYVNFGADVGAVMVGVEEYKTAPVFDGRFGWSVGGHLKLSTPYLFDRVALLALGNYNLFRSTNKFGAYYGGADAAAAAGLQIRLWDGYLSLGPQIYAIMGKNRGFDGTKGKYSNLNNMRAWIAYEYFPDDIFGGEHKPYMSFELTVSPKIRPSKRVPFREFSASISVGTITRRLYGEGRDGDD